MRPGYGGPGNLWDRRGGDGQDHLNGSRTLLTRDCGQHVRRLERQIGVRAAADHTATATDPAGNISASSAALKFSVDTIASAAPTISDSSVQSGFVNAARDTSAQTLSGTAAAGDTLKIYLNGSTTPYEPQPGQHVRRLERQDRRAGERRL